MILFSEDKGKVEVMKVLTSNLLRNLVLSLPMFATCLPIAAVAQEEDRPVIVVPRGGGKETFSRFCTTCHMPDGRGGQNEGGYGADLRVTKLSVDEVIGVVTNGRQSKGMPSFKGIIDEEKIGLVANYVKTVIKLKE
jgi:mono/diheme cytochrome c family protein